MGCSVPIEQAAELYEKQQDFERTQPPGPLFHLRQTHVLYGEGEGPTIYFGRHRGAGYIGLHLSGFCGWSSSPRWMPGGWEFMNPMLQVGRLYCDRGRSWSCEAKVPHRLYMGWKWATSSSWRRAMRETPEEAP